MASQKGPLQKKKPLAPPGAKKAGHRPLVKPQQKKKKDDSSDSSRNKGFLGLSFLSCCSKKDDKKKKQPPKAMPQAKKAAVPVAKPQIQQKIPTRVPPPAAPRVLPKPVVVVPPSPKKPLRSVEITKEEQMKTAKNIPPPGSTKELITEEKPKNKKRSDEKVKDELKEIATARDLDEPSSRDNKKKPSKEKTPKRSLKKKEEEIVPDEDTKQQTLVIKKFIRGNKAVFRWEYEETHPLHTICEKAMKNSCEKSSYCCQCCYCKGNEKGKVCA